MTMKCGAGVLVIAVMTSAIAMEAAAQQVDNGSPNTASAATGGGDSGTALYKSHVSVVSLGITVTDAREKDMPGLTKEDFAVFEDGRPQEVRYFASEPTPLDLAILLDTSGSMTQTLPDVRRAALQLASALRPGDRASFTEVKRGMRELQPLSSDTSGLSRAVQAITTGGTTAIYDAIYIALHNLAQTANPTEVRRQALVILSDGVDTSSLLPYENVLDAARRHGVTIYAVSLRGRRPRGWKPASTPMALMETRVDGDFALRTLAQQTGGQAFFDLESRDLAPACQRIAHELANQYSIGYFPTNPADDGRFHLLSVRVTTVPGVRARTRTGYFASPETRRARR